MAEALALAIYPTRALPLLTHPPKFEGRDRYFPLQGTRTTISISTLISGL